LFSNLFPPCARGGAINQFVFWSSQNSKFGFLIANKKCLDYFKVFLEQGIRAILAVIRFDRKRNRSSSLPALDHFVIIIKATFENYFLLLYNIRILVTSPLSKKNIVYRQCLG
jgi:hypothetical protein